MEIVTKYQAHEQEHCALLQRPATAECEYEYEFDDSAAPAADDSTDEADDFSYDGEFSVVAMPDRCVEEWDAALASDMVGTVRKITRHDPRSGFLVARLKVSGEPGLVAVKGYVASVEVGDLMVCRGDWVVDPIYGRQFRATSLRVLDPECAEAALHRPPQVELSGCVTRISHHNKETGFLVAKIKVKGDRKQVTVTGKVAGVIIGETLVCSGEWITDPTHGIQFHANSMHVVPPDSIEGLEKYLGSGLIKGIGPELAKQLTARFGSEVLNIIENNPDELLKVPKIGKKKVAQITNSWNSALGMKALLDFLRNYAIDASKSLKVFQAYGERAIETITANPYRLFYDINGFDFRTADEIAMRMGFLPESMLRVQAGARYCMREIVSRGHCACTMEALADQISKDIGVGLELAKSAINAEIQAGALTRDEIGGQSAVYRTELYYAETGVANDLLRLLDGTPPWHGLDVEKVIPWAEQQTGLPLSPSQRRAVEMALSNKVMVITGGPGVGKTTIVNAILHIIRSTGAEVTTCAPTGRAAKRMTESTGQESKTIHRLLGVDSYSKDFKHNRQNQLPTDYVVIDEASMVDVTLMYALLSSIPDHAGVLIIGDVDQLPSVGPGAVLMDIIASDRIPTARLTEIHRQAKNSKIVENAHQINIGQPLILSASRSCDFYFIKTEDSEQILKKTVDVVTQGVPRLYGYDPISEVQVLTPMNDGLLGAHTLNAELQKRINPPKGETLMRNDMTFAAGDKVIQIRINNYEKMVFNGDTGIIRSISGDQGVVVIEFDGRLVEYSFADMDDIVLSYATTIHKSQGSEYPCVVIPLGMEHNSMLERNLLYTAVTRGKKMVIVIGQQRAIAEATKRHNSPKRQTKLAFRLNTMY